MKRLVTLAILLGVLVMGVTTAEAAPGATTVSEYPVNFVVSSATCSHLPAGTTVTGSGTETSITSVTTDSNNLTTTLNATRAIGTATDQNGASYVFNYVNHYRLTSTAADPTVGTGWMTDTFSLTGNGPANLRNGFVAGLTSMLDFSSVSSWNLQNSFGDPIAFAPGPFVAHCDPL